jgi:hypothetical protein
MRDNELGAAFADVWCAIPKVVFSRTLDSVQGNARLAQASVAEEAAAALDATDKDVSIGGAGLAGHRRRSARPGRDQDVRLERDLRAVPARPRTSATPGSITGGPRVHTDGSVAWRRSPGIRAGARQSRAVRDARQRRRRGMRRERGGARGPDPGERNRVLQSKRRLSRRRRLVAARGCRNARARQSARRSDRPCDGYRRPARTLRLVSVAPPHRLSLAAGVRHRPGAVDLGGRGHVLAPEDAPWPAQALAGDFDDFN